MVKMDVFVCGDPHKQLQGLNEVFTGGKEESGDLCGRWWQASSKTADAVQGGPDKVPGTGFS